MTSSVEHALPLSDVVVAADQVIPIEFYWEQRYGRCSTAAEDHGLVGTIKTKLRKAANDECRQRTAPSIHRVRGSVRSEDPRAYEPQVISIGPFHHGKRGLKEAEKLKQRFVNDLLRRSAENSVEAYIQAVREVGPQARAQYAGDIPFDDDEFVEMMVIDGCFVVECLLKRGLGLLDDELAACANCNAALLGNDLLLIENQIPFSVLDALFGVTSLNWRIPGGHRAPTLVEFAAHFFKIGKVPEGRIYHLLHLYQSSLRSELTRPARRQHGRPRSRILFSLARSMVGNTFFPVLYRLLYLIMMCRWPRLSPLISSDGRQQRFPRMIPCATELREAGIKIKRKQADEEADQEIPCMLDVTFEHGVLEIPFLSVESSTKTKFRNLVAFEQCRPDQGDNFTSYAVFLDNLVNTAADVATLRSCGVLESKLGSDEEVAQMFNTVCRGSHLRYETHYLAPVFRDVKCYCETARHRWRAKLVHDYFNSPWSVISVVVAFLLLVFTGVQAIFAALAYFRPPRP